MPRVSSIKKSDYFILELKRWVIFATNYSKNFLLKMAGPDFFFFASLGQLIFFHKHSINFFFREKAYHPAPLNYTYWSLIVSPSPLGNMACVYILLIIYLSIESLASSIWLAVDATI
jgi:hypothetical protein